MTRIDPFELHPEVSRPIRPSVPLSLTVGDLDSIVDGVIIQMHSGPDKLWGHTKGDIEYWLRTVVHETEKVLTKEGV